MKKSISVLAFAAIAGLVSPAVAGERYLARPPVVVSPDLTAPWVLQLNPGQAKKRAVVNRQLHRQRATQRRNVVRQASVRPQAVKRTTKPVAPKIDPRFLPQVVEYNSNDKAGTIIIDTQSRYLYLVLGDGQARRYGVGVGKAGFEWTGTQKISRKAEWPSWRPPAEMIAREKKKGRHLPTYMEGGPQNPLGARALYLGSTLYRIHGTNQPWTIGQAVSSGCIRMRNQDVVDLYERARVGAKVRVI